ncbi:MAG TPA: response regulator, partial [Streptosporangiaceae bacterium]
MPARFPQPLTARLAALPPRSQELVQDLGLGLALAVVNVFSLLPYRSQLHPLWLALTLVAAQGLPLAGRRYWPIGVALVIGGTRVAYDQIGFGFAPFPLGPAIALYTVMDRRSATWRWVSLLVVGAAIGISQAAPGHHQPYDTIFQLMIFLAAAAAGLLSRAKRASIEAAQSRADRAEAELDRQSSQAAERERIRIARELHDVVAHHVSLIAVQAEAASSLLPGRPDQARRSVEVIGDTARQALTELRRLLGVLRRPSARLETAPSASLGEARGRARPGPRHRAGGRLRGRGHPGRAGARRGPDRVPHRAGGADEHHPARQRRPGRRQAALRAGIHHGERDRFRSPAAVRRPRDRGRRSGPAAGRGRSRPGRHRRTGGFVRRQPDRRPGPGNPGNPGSPGGWLRRDRAAAVAMTAPAAAGPGGPGPIRVLVVDDQELVRSGFCVILDTVDGIAVVGEAANGEEALAAASAHHPDVVLMDIRMPGMDGLEATRRLTRGGPDLTPPKVVMLTTFDLDEYVYEALRAGASGFLLKDSPRADLIAAVRAAAAGNALLAPTVTRRLIEAFARRPPEAAPSPARLASL